MLQSWSSVRRGYGRAFGADFWLLLHHLRFFVSLILKGDQSLLLNPGESSRSYHTGRTWRHAQHTVGNQLRLCPPLLHSSPPKHLAPRGPRKPSFNWVRLSSQAAQLAESDSPLPPPTCTGCLFSAPDTLCVDSRNCTEMLCLPETSLIKAYPSSIPLPQGLTKRLGLLNKPFQASKGRSLALDLVPAASVF